MQPYQVIIFMESCLFIVCLSAFIALTLSENKLGNRKLHQRCALWYLSGGGRVGSSIWVIGYVLMKLL